MRNIFQVTVTAAVLVAINYSSVLGRPQESNSTNNTSILSTGNTSNDNKNLTLSTENQATTTGKILQDNASASTPVLSVTSVSNSTTEPSSGRTLESRAISGTIGNGNHTAEFDGPIRRCNYGGNTDVNKCLRQILEDLKPRLASGIPEINLPPMDPLHLNSVSFHHGSGPIKILATFNDVNATGLSTFDRSDFVFDVKKRVLDFDLNIPTMRIVGNYELSGNLFFFPIGGTGGFWLNIGGIRAKGQGKLGVSAKNNLKTIHIKKIDIDLDIETIKVHLSNLFHGDQILGSVINTFLNENSKDIFEEVRPQIGIQVGEMVQVLTNRALASLSADHFADIRADPEV